MCIGGGICVVEALGLCRDSLVPVGIALSAGDWLWVVSVFMPLIACSADPLVSWGNRFVVGFAVDPERDCKCPQMSQGRDIMLPLPGA